MASTPTPLPPPPGSEDSAPGTPTTPVAASPSPPTPSPALQSGTQDIIQIVAKLRGIAKAYPAAAQHVATINDEMRQIMRIVMQHQNPGEPAAPPTAG